jgi:hypothetical protein
MIYHDCCTVTTELALSVKVSAAATRSGLGQRAVKRGEGGGNPRRRKRGEVFITDKVPVC